LNVLTFLLTGAPAIFAIPGQLVSPLCPELPEEVRDVLSRTQFSKIADAAVALSIPPKTLRRWNIGIAQFSARQAS
jgi:hypothetical protein